jgi:hypothetical protein
MDATPSPKVYNNKLTQTIIYITIHTFGDDVFLINTEAQKPYYSTTIAQ